MLLSEQECLFEQETQQQHLFILHPPVLVKAELLSETETESLIDHQHRRDICH